MGDLVERLREHAYRVGPNDSNYDPETLDLETAAADRIEDSEAEIERLREALERAETSLTAVAAHSVQKGIADDAVETLRVIRDAKRKYDRDMRIVRETRAAVSAEKEEA